MSKAIFLDTSGWLAVLSERDARHEAATDAYHAVLNDGRGLVTTNLVVAEMHILLVGRRGVSAGLRFLDAVSADPTHEVIFATSELHRTALDEWLRPYGDHDLSLANAVSFATMKELNIGQALALDRHFEIAGFELMPSATATAR